MQFVLVAVELFSKRVDNIKKIMGRMRFLVPQGQDSSLAIRANNNGGVEFTARLIEEMEGEGEAHNFTFIYRVLGGRTKIIVEGLSFLSISVHDSRGTNAILVA